MSSATEIIETITHAAVSCGFPKALNATFVAKRVFGNTVCFPKGPSTVPYFVIIHDSDLNNGRVMASIPVHGGALGLSPRE